MPSTIVVGGQYGSEGKGKVVALAACLCREPWVVRCGGPNSGHTVWVGGKRTVFRQIPAAAGHPNALLLLSAGCAIDEAILHHEADRLGLPRDQIVVDPRAMLVTDEDKTAESGIVGSIGSTGSGTGAALIRRMGRGPGVRLAGDAESVRARFRVESVAPLLHAHLDRGGDVVIEGTQGFGLSLLHGPDYPYVTSRDTTAAGFASEVGLSPRQVDEIILVVRTYPIRVGGQSGPLHEELTWEDVRVASGAPETVPEFTSVTQKLRRVGRFDIESVKQACQYNRPTGLAVMGLDRLDYRNHRAQNFEQLTDGARTFLLGLEKACGVPVIWVGTGYETSEAFPTSSRVGRDPVYARSSSGAPPTAPATCGAAQRVTRI